MPRPDYFLTVGDRLPVIQETLLGPDGSPADLTGATVVILIRRADHSTPESSAAATIVNAGAGSVEYDWQASDSASAGLYNARWRATYADGRVATFPNDDHPILILVSGGT